jgi:hypothetical protein
MNVQLRLWFIKGRKKVGEKRCQEPFPAGGPDCSSIGVPHGTRGIQIDEKTSCGFAAPIAKLSGPPACPLTMFTYMLPLLYEKG